MKGPKLFHPADWGEAIDEVCNAAGNPLYKQATLTWCPPRPWDKGTDAPVTKEDDASIYAIVRNHGKSKTKDIIEYIGLTIDPESRFRNHQTARDIVEQRGTVGISFAPISFIRGRNKIRNIKRALDEIEHILIWALEPRHNQRKNYTLPGMGQHRGNAWHVISEGYRFAGQMPLELVFPWMLVKLGRNRANKVAI
jgi:hypothetical protein